MTVQLYEFLKEAVKRHLDETMPLIQQLKEVDIMSQPAAGVKEIGEVVLHMLRSLEYYLRGLVEDKWEAAPYTLEDYDSAEAIIELAERVFGGTNGLMSLMLMRDLKKKIDSFNRPATRGEILLEMLEHSIHHRGQITVYYRLLGITPNKIEYII
jgi:uncharacterized damage-inducible protein DinB